MSVTIGRTVLYTMPEACKSVNGARTFPAIVTMVHGAECVNLRVFFDVDPQDAAINERVTSVPFSAEQGVPFSWCWPPRNVAAS